MRARDPRSRKFGFTLLELLTVIAVVAILAAVLLPSLSRVRERARQTDCQSRLRQLGMGLMMKSQQDEAYPVGCLGCRFQPGQTMRMISWNALILPFIDQREIHQSFNFDLPSHHAANLTVGSTVVDLFICPSTTPAPTRNLKGLWKGHAFTDFGGIYGVEGVGRSNTDPLSIHYLKPEFLGVMLYEQAVRPRDIEDGTAYTVCLAEMLERRKLESEWASGQNVFAQEGSTGINQRSGLGNEIGSPHSGGASAAFADGHVEFLGSKIDQAVLNALLTKAGQELARQE